MHICCYALFIYWTIIESIPNFNCDAKLKVIKIIQKESIR